LTEPGLQASTRSIITRPLEMLGSLKLLIRDDFSAAANCSHRVAALIQILHFVLYAYVTHNVSINAISHCRINARLYSFLFPAISTLSNSLPERIVKCGTVQTFRRHLDMIDLHKFITYKQSTCAACICCYMLLLDVSHRCHHYIGLG